MDEQEPQISVIIPVYRVEEYLEECLISVLSQEGVQRVELLLVDDCGGDDSMNIARRVLETLPEGFSCQLLSHACNSGPSAGRNTGLAKARGAYIFFLDSDDILLPGALETFYHAAQASQADMVLGEYKMMHGDDFPGWAVLRLDGAVKGREAFEAYLNHGWFQTAHNMLLRRSFLETQGLSFEEGLLNEDELWGMHLAMCGPHVAVVKQPTYLYRNEREGSIVYKLNQSSLPLRSLNMAYIAGRWLELAQRYGYSDNPHFKRRLQRYFYEFFFDSVWVQTQGWCNRFAYLRELQQRLSPLCIDFMSHCESPALRGVARIYRAPYLPFRRGVLMLYLLARHLGARARR